MKYLLLSIFILTVALSYLHQELKVRRFINKHEKTKAKKEKA